ncbi:hypothetical protein ACJ72_04413, partial [Emergomyces africanus]
GGLTILFFNGYIRDLGQHGHSVSPVKAYLGIIIFVSIVLLVLIQEFFWAFGKLTMMIKFLFLFAGLFTLVECQSLIPTTGSATFPGCAIGCPLLREAQTNCVPPAAPSTNQATYISCFCQSSLLQALHSSPNGVCDAVCPPADLTKLQTWYAGFCSAGNPELTQTTTTSATRTPSPNSGSDSGAGKSENVNQAAPQSWFSAHWKWVVMIIVLVVGFAALAFLLVWLKRRHKRKRANQAPFPPAQPTATPGAPSSRNLVAAALGDDKWTPQQHHPHVRAQGPRNAGSTVPAFETTRGTEPGRLARAPHSSSRIMQGPSQLKNQI